MKQFKPTSHNYFHYGVCINPHYTKRDKGGEDAVVTGNNLLAVADGVGGWASAGIDPAFYSRRLCKLMDNLFHDTHTEPVDKD